MALNRLLNLPTFVRSALSALSTNQEPCDHKTPIMPRPHFVEDSNTIEYFQCPICLDIVWQPLQGRCGHRFCQSCVVEHIGHSETCPLCREPIQIKSLNAWNGNGGDMDFDDYLLYLQLQICCTSCVWRGDLNDWRKHILSAECDVGVDSSNVRDDLLLDSNLEPNQDDTTSEFGETSSTYIESSNNSTLSQDVESIERLVEWLILFNPGSAHTIFLIHHRSNGLIKLLNDRIEFVAVFRRSAIPSLDEMRKWDADYIRSGSNASPSFFLNDDSTIDVYLFISWPNVFSWKFSDMLIFSPSAHLIRKFQAPGRVSCLADYQMAEHLSYLLISRKRMLKKNNFFCETLIRHVCKPIPTLIETRNFKKVKSYSRRLLDFIDNLSCSLHDKQAVTCLPCNIFIYEIYIKLNNYVHELPNEKSSIRSTMLHSLSKLMQFLLASKPPGFYKQFGKTQVALSVDEEWSTRTDCIPDMTALLALSCDKHYEKVGFLSIRFSHDQGIIWDHTVNFPHEFDTTELNSKASLQVLCASTNCNASILRKFLLRVRSKEYNLHSWNERTFILELLSDCDTLRS